MPSIKKSREIESTAVTTTVAGKAQPRDKLAAVSTVGTLVDRGLCRRTKTCTRAGAATKETTAAPATQLLLFVTERRNTRTSEKVMT
jgi:hypothetical protein